MTRTRHSVCAAAVAVGLLLSTPGLAAAEPVPAGPNDIATLIAAVANANQQLQDIGAAVQTRQESVNKAIVDVQTARDQADAAKADVAASQRAVEDANAAIAAAQQRVDTYAASAYINGPSASYLTATTPEDLIATASAGETLALSAKQTLADLQRARTEQVNRDSAARAAQQRADQAAADAQRSQEEAVAALTDAQREFGEQKAQVDRLAAERDAAKARLEAARAQWSTSAATVPAPAAAAPAPGDRWDAPGANAPASQPNPGNWDTTVWDPLLPAIPSAFVSGDPIAIINAVLGIAATSSQVTADLGRNFLIKMGIIKPNQPDTGITNGRIPRVYGQQASEYVIQRGMSQIGVPYSWGGGTAAGASIGARRRHCGLRLLRTGSVLVRRCRDQAAALLRRSIRHGPQDPGSPDAPRRRHLLRPRRQPARDHLPRQECERSRPNAGGPTIRGAGESLAGAHQRHDAVRRALHRILTRRGSAFASDSSAADRLCGPGAAADCVRDTGGGRA